MGPLIEEEGYVPIHVDTQQPIYQESGFPFDREELSDRDSFRDQLADLAHRHPEFAEHLRRPSSPGATRRHQRTPQSHDFYETPAGDLDDDHYHHPRTRAHPFAGFDRFFPFDPTFERYYEEDLQPPSHRQWTHDRSNQEPKHTQRREEEFVSEPLKTEKNRQEFRSGGKPPVQQRLQQSQTVDLGQTSHQQQQQQAQNAGTDSADAQDVSAAGHRRSMSAPPQDANRPRFVSSINIPHLSSPRTNRTAGIPAQNPESTGDMGPAIPSQQSHPTERIIPIHVEGRDGPPIVGKPQPQTTPSSAGGAAAPQPHPSSNQQQQQEKVMFGQPANKFIRFLPRNEGSPTYVGARGGDGVTQEELLLKEKEEELRRQQAELQRQQAEVAKQRDEIEKQRREYEKKQRDAFEQHQQQQQQQQRQEPPAQSQQQQQGAPPPPAPPQLKPNPLELIQAIQKDVSELMNQVEHFAGRPKDKQYAYLDEMLTRNLLKLDNIETEGKDSIRGARKEAIKCIERCIGILEAKAVANEEKSLLLQQEQPSEVTPPVEKTETVVTDETSTTKPDEISAPAETESEKPIDVAVVVEAKPEIGGGEGEVKQEVKGEDVKKEGDVSAASGETTSGKKKTAKKK